MTVGDIQPRGPVRERTTALQFVQDNEPRIREFAVTVFVLSYLAVLEGPAVADSTLALFTAQRAER
jgi:hypothetical protein